MHKSASGDDGELSPEDMAERDRTLGVAAGSETVTPGRYRTRAGHPAVVKKVSSNKEDAYPCKGYYVTTRAGHPSQHISAMWALSGRYSASGPNILDLVRKYEAATKK